MSRKQSSQCWRHTVLNTIRAPLIFRNLTEYDEAMVEKFVYDAILCVGFQVLKSVLTDEVG